MKKMILIFTLVFSVSIFSINFGGGGYILNYIPKDQVKQINPLKDYLSFDELILQGGGGFGIIPGGSYFGGEGYSGETTNGNYKLYVSQGYFTFGKQINLNIINIDVGIGLGGGETIVSKKVDESRNGKSIDDIVNNIDSVPYVVQLKREEVSISPRAKIYLNLMEFLSVVIEGKFTYNYSPENWKIEGEYQITDNVPNYNYYYSFGAGIIWGF
ncbi:hypothetical protein X275_04665 [Marinitoga sp. 1197]|uniref:Outer membrane protein beta-barrel domain-containing protein n=1 Tax=Marinitoga hydrogenitolerans (strain DSM 16785 / JCM 12826 / AT1271) TaxID=1122195 RepID=A0A1M4S6R9_MARH1|nr:MULTISPECIES: hypothetical protein [Marinitoga]KLO22851.1 hypothetical protein X275_04665 [Marinitoga sp. 1197]SHE27906.1 hypothetical protein SAMN02745164_00092 [Marinitoga hydrogenitolerans DSM 16785]